MQALNILGKPELLCSFPADSGIDRIEVATGGD